MQDQFRKLCPRTTCQEGDAIQGAHAEWGQTLGLSIQGIWCHSAMDSDHPKDPRFTGREIEAPAACLDWSMQGTYCPVPSGCPRNSGVQILFHTPQRPIPRKCQVPVSFHVPVCPK